MNKTRYIYYQDAQGNIDIVDEKNSSLYEKQHPNNYIRVSYSKGDVGLPIKNKQRFFDKYKDEVQYTQYNNEWQPVGGIWVDANRDMDRKERRQQEAMRLSAYQGDVYGLEQEKKRISLEREALRDNEDMTRREKRQEKRFLKDEEKEVNKMIYGTEDVKEHRMEIADSFEQAAKENIAKAKEREAENPYYPIPGHPAPTPDYEATLYRMAAMNNRAAERAWKANSRFEETTGFGNFAQGAGHTLGSEEFWTLRDEESMFRIRDVIKKMDKGQEVSDAEQNLLESYMDLMTAKAARSEDLSKAYQSGQMAAESVPFMVEMFLTKGLGSAVKKSTKEAVEALIKKSIGKSVIGKTGQRVASFVGHEASNVTRAFVAPSTYGAIADEAVKIDEDGSLTYGDMQSAARGLFSGVAEIASEESGEAIQKGFGWLLGKTFGQGAKNIYNNVRRSGLGKVVSTAGFNGLVGEAAEEWYRTGLDAIAGLATGDYLGDKKAFKDFATAEQQLIMIGGFAPMSVIGMGANLAGLAEAKSLYNKSLQGLQSIMEKHNLTETDIEAVTSYLNEGDNVSAVREMFKVLKSGVSQEDLTNEEAKQLYTDIANLAMANARLQVNEDAIKEMQGLMAQSTDVFNNYLIASGNPALIQNTLYDANNAYNEQVERAIVAGFDAQEITATDAMTMASKAATLQKQGLAKEADILLDLAKAKATMQGLEDASEVVRSKAIDDSQRWVQSIVREDGMVRPVRIGNDIVYLTDEKVEFDEFGAPIRGGFDNTLVEITKFDGSKDYISFDDMDRGLQSAVSAEDMNLALSESIHQENDRIWNEALNTKSVWAKAKDVAALKDKSVYFTNEEGRSVSATVKGMTQNGDVILAGKKGELGDFNITMNTSEFYDRLMRDNNGNVIINEAPQEQAQQPDKQQQGLNETQTNAHQTQTDARQTQADSNKIGTGDTFVYGDAVATITSVDSEIVTAEYTDENGRRRTIEVPTQEAEDLVADYSAKQEEGKAAAEQEDKPLTPSQRGVPVKRDKNGKPVLDENKNEQIEWTEYLRETTDYASYLNDFRQQAELSDEDLRSSFTSMLAKAEEDLKKESEKTPADPSALIAHVKKMQQLKKDVEAYRGIVGAISPQQEPAQEAVQEQEAAETQSVEGNQGVTMQTEPLSTSESAAQPSQSQDVAQKSSQKKRRALRYAKEDAELGEYIDFRDYVMRAIATGAAKFIWSDSKSGTKGLGKHLGLGQSNEERNKRIWLLSNESGSYPEIVAQNLLASFAAEALNPQADPYEATGMTDMDALDVILDVLQSYSTPRAMFDAVRERHQKNKDPYYDMTEEEIEAMERGVSVPEFRADIDAMNAYIEDIANNIPDEIINRIFAEINEQYEYNRTTDGLHQGVSEGQGLDSGMEEGSGLLSEEQTDITGEISEDDASGQRREDSADEHSSDNLYEESDEQPTGEQIEDQETKLPTLTEQQILSLDVDEDVATMAIAYLNGNNNPLCESAYIALQEYVQNEILSSAGNSADGNSPLMAGESDGTASNLVGGSGQSDRRLDRGNDKSDVSESGQSGQNGTGGLLVPDGEGSGSSMGVGESDVADSAGSQRSRGRDRRSSTGSNVRERGRHSNSDGISSEDGKRRAETQSDGVRADDLINEGLEEIKNLLSGAGVQKNRLYSIGGAAAQGGMLTIKLISAGAKVGYGLVLKGFHQFKKWKEAMFNYLGPVFSANSAFSDDYIDKFIDDMWDAPITRDGETHTIQEWASIMEQKELRKAVRMSLEEKRKIQAERESVETIVGDIDNIRESLPFLMPAQQEDVEKAEKQFFDESHKDRAHGYGKGILFTNGTGTGKTYTGLGIVKRFVKQGKGRVLIVTAQDQKIQDWIRDAKNLGIEATQLADTKSKGAGVVVTQFANMRQNKALLEDEFDLIVYDESHKLMENKDGSMTTACVFHHQLSNKDVEQAARRMLREHPIFKKELELLEEISKINDILKKTSDKVTREESEKLQSIGGPGNANVYISNLQNQINLLKEEQNKVIVAKLSDSEFLEEAKKAVDKTKVVFLSASPFNTAKNLDYVEGYIFSYNPEAERYEGGENLPSEDREKIRDKFVLKTFPSSHDKLSNGEVRMRSESQIANPQKSSDEEIAFTDGLINQGSLSGRVLDSEYDYSREFPRLDFPLAQEFNKLYQSIQPNKKYAMLAEVFKDFFDKYDKYTAFFEAIKAEFAIERINEHLALGRKVVVFHRRRSSQDDSGNGIGTPLTDCIEKFLSDSDFRYKLELMNFVNEFRDFLAWERSANLDFPHYKIAEAFATEEEKHAYAADLEKWQKKVQEATMKGKKIPAKPVIRTKRVQVFNGAETEANKRSAVKNFNDDNSGCDIFVAQVASAKEGIDAHDTTGKHQRVEVNLYLPQSPLEFMQAEGRIYRIGNKSNAVIEYPLLGIDFELASFAYKINGRSQTSENLAMGSQSRGLRDSIARAALSSKAIPVSANQGIGGKMLDKRDFYKQDNFNDSINNYNEWKASQSEDYTQKMIPDPIGERMVAWAMTESGDTVYIPNAGEGSVARYVPQNCRLVAQEEDVARYSKLVTLCGGGGRKILNEDYHEHINRSNDVILSFLPNMSDEKERDNNSMSAFRLNDSGRMIAVTTAGSVRLPNYGVYRARIILPLSAMGIDKNLRGHLVNGTSLEIHIIDVLNNKELRERAQKEVLKVDLSHITSEEELWNALKEIVVPSRIIDNIAKVKKRVDKVLDVVKGSPFVRKEKDYRSGKMVPAISSYDNGMDIKLKRGYLSIYYGHITPGNKDYNFDYVERLARQWVQRNREIENYEDSTDKYSQEIEESAKIAAQIIESALGKTPSQIRNIADGINENAVMGKLDIDAYKDIVNSFINNDASLTALSEKVMSMAAMFGITAEVANDNSPQFNTKSGSTAAYFSLNEGKVWIRNSFVNSLRVTNEQKGQVMLHEMIHAVTSYALNMYEMGMIKEGTPLFDACRDIYEVYDAIKEDPTFTQYIKGESGREAANNEYGTSSVHEMIAELSNPAFRLALKAKKLWRQLINGVKRLLGINITGDATEMNALVALEDALDRLLDNIDKDVYEQQKKAIMQFAKENNMDYYLAKEVTDPALIDKLENGPKIKAYRAMQIIGGVLYPPMSAKVDGALREPTHIGRWEESEERPDLANEKGYFKLDKGNKSSVPARYNPYFHSSPTPLNDQFASAQDRPNLVTVEVEIPESELTSGYKADKAKDSVGEMEWKAGVVQSKLSGTRTVYLSRWDKPIRIVPDSEVADEIVKMFDGKDITMPSNVVTPSLRAELEKRGVPFIETDNQGRVIDNKSSEINDIIARSKANGTYMKAPNGNPTNLTEEQWAMVRTSSFKKWFGDWELAAMETPIFKSKGTFANLSQAEQWAKDNLQGQSRVNKYTGEQISISRKSVSEMLNEKALNKSHSINTHLAALQSVLDFIENGIPAEVHPDTHGRDFDVMRLYNAIEIDGMIYRVKSTVRKVRQGDKFYTYEVQEMELIEERGANPNREGETPHNGNTSNNSITGAKLLNGVKKTNSNEDILQYSKIVDENGEPRVMYHGTDSEFTSFEMQDGSMGRGAYFTSNWDEAAEYAMEKQGVESIDELDESKIQEVFLNVRDDSNITHSRFSRGDIEVVATSPNQIKSATDNNGEFGESDDIRFRHEANSATGAVKDGLIVDRLTPIAQRLGLKVRFVKRKDMPKAYMNDKGFYNTSTEEIIICPENHDSLNDAYSTLLHEGVAHHGLRALMGDSFDEFLDRVYNALPPTKRLVLAREAREKYGHLSNPLQVATEEYLATLAENMDFNKSEQTLWDKIKAIFNDIMRKLFGNEDYTISDGDLRYILQASYNHLNDPRGGRTLQGWAKDRRLREKAHSNDGNNIRRREGAPSSSDIAKTLYEKEVSSRWNKFQQEFQDGQQAVRVGIKAIQEETGGKRITDSEDYITKQNHKSSIDSAQVKAYVRDYYEPIDKELKAISDILIKERGYNDNNDTRSEVYDILMQYLISKHGLERDAYYNNEHAKEEGYKPHEWSGLSSLFQCEWEKATERAQELVKEIEEQVGEETINALWEKINKANEYTLRHNRDSGLITKEQYEKASKMFKYYIPLRGFSEKTAEEEYFNSYGRSNRYSPYLVTKSTKGRKSLADNPIATMMWMAENAISQGNKNLVKQAFYRFVQNRPNSLIMEADTWYVIEDGELVASYPDIREGMTDSEIKSAYNEFYQKMRALAKEGKAFKEGDTPKLPFRMVNPRHKNDHLIVVRVAGKDRTLIVHGDPALAKAVNDIAPETSEFEKAVRKTSRIISSTYTTYSVDFIARNMIRDMIYSNMSAATRDHFEGRTNLSAEEKKRLNSEFDVAFKKAYMENMVVPGRMIKLLVAFRNGTLNMSKPLEREFAEFINNGGQTGYSQIDSVEKHKRELERRMKRCKQGRDENVLEIIGGSIELLNEGAELMSRFAAYRAGRAVGMSIQQSIAEAKEISVNFNRRGEQSGKGFLGGVARYLGLYKYFFNAGVQGSQNIIKLAKTAPLAMSVRVLSWVAWGCLMSLFNSWLASLFGGDEDEYWNLPEYVRQNNICLGWGKHFFFMIPLPIEMRAIYSVGDIIASVALDKRLKKDFGTVALDIVSRVLSVFPVNPIENVAGVDDVVSALGKYVFPDITQPVLQALNNENFAGQPIYKDNPWDKGKPYFMRVYAGGPRWLTRISEGLYRASFNGESGIDFNPEIVDHLFSGYLGGLYGLVKNLAYTTEDVIKGNATLNDVPIARTLIKTVRDESFYTSTYWECKDVLESSFSSFKAMEPKATKELLYGDDVPQQWKNKYNMFQKGHYSAMKAFYQGSKELEKKEKKLKEWKEKAKEGKNIPQEKMDALEAEIILDRRELIDNVLRLY